MMLRCCRCRPRGLIGPEMQFSKTSMLLLFLVRRVESGGEVNYGMGMGVLVLVGFISQITAAIASAAE